jgi:protein TonB
MDYAHDNHFSAKKAGGIGFTVLIHLLVACALIYGLHTTFAPKPAPPDITVIDPTHAPPQKVALNKESVRKPYDLSTAMPKLEFPALPKINSDSPSINFPSDEKGDAKLDDGANIGTGGDTIGKGLSTPASFDLNGCKPEYPRSSVLGNETGVVRLRFDIGANSQLLSVSVLRSSGYKMLDNAAVAGLSKCKFKAAMQDGAPVSSNFMADYAWTLESD